jgi:hypothetical protein
MFRKYFEPQPQPDIRVFGMRIGEPVTAFTGLLIALSSGYVWWHMGQLSTRTTPQETLRWFFAALAAANVVGSLVGHAFLHRVTWRWKIPGWTFGMLSAFFLAQTAIEHFATVTDLGGGRWLTAANLLAFVVGLWVVVRQAAFKLVEVHAAFCVLLLMLPLEYWLWQSGDAAAGWMLLGIVPMLGAVLLHMAKFSVSRWLNFFDLGHLLLCWSVWYFWLAALRM